MSTPQNLYSDGRYLQPDWPAPASVEAFVTTRSGGVSDGPWRSLNLGLRSGDDTDQVLQNRAVLMQDWSMDKIQWLKQVHGADVARADQGCEEKEADACWSAVSGRACAVLTADCLPVLFCNRSGTRVAAAHAGWRGLAGGVLENTAAVFDDSPDALMAWLGPAISQPCFEVGPEVREAFLAHDPEAESAFVAGQGDRWFADIYTLARQRLTAMGIYDVYGGDYCTVRQEELFFSYRRDGAKSGRLASVIWLAETDG
ncbi:MAG: multi-copper polyphenol oxidoreductase [Oceanospirillales bacterium LUC14_002_19_P2]|nr:MAG: multi-copper polyphenol oxidoreductase [Oceanospirillales bacterium LUC14_002_19_P2]